MASGSIFRYPSKLLCFRVAQIRYESFIVPPFALHFQSAHKVCVIACFLSDDVNMPKLVKTIISKVNKVSIYSCHKCQIKSQQVSGAFQPIKMPNSWAQVSPRCCCHLLHQSERALWRSRALFAGFPSMLWIEAGISSIWRREVSVWRD